MSKLILVSFADSRYRRSLDRLRSQTEGFPFDERHFLTEKNCLTPAYWRKLKPWLYRRGYGYWNWKFKLVQHYLRQMADGDMLYFSDAGITWNNSSQAIDHFKETINKLSGEEDILVYSQPCITQEWTKGDVLKEFGVYDNDEICKSKQLFCGFFCLKKTAHTTEIVDRLVDYCDLKRELVTDRRSTVPNKEGFCENRHDQSIFSLLIRKEPHIEIAYSHSYELMPDGSENTDCPIQVVRQKEKELPKSEKLRNKLLFPWRLFLDFYFKRVRHYYYTAARYPW